MIQTIIFDFGGVIATLDGDEAKKRFSDLGVADVDSRTRPLSPARLLWRLGRRQDRRGGISPKVGRDVWSRTYLR